MSSKKRTRTPVQRALIELRTKLGHSQESLAREMDVTLPTVGKWETSTPPAGVALAALHALAVMKGHPELGQVFIDELHKLQGIYARKANDILDEIARWQKIKAHLTTLGQIDAAVRSATSLKEAKEAVAPMYDLLVEFERVLAAAQKWSWKNR